MKRKFLFLLILAVIAVGVSSFIIGTSFAKWECPVCLDMIKDGELEISNCGHFYCKPCLDTIKDKAQTEHLEKWECAVCRRKHKVSGED